MGSGWVPEGLLECRHVAFWFSHVPEDVLDGLRWELFPPGSCGVSAPYWGQCRASGELHLQPLLHRPRKEMGVGKEVSTPADAQDTGF